MIGPLSLCSGRWNIPNSSVHVTGGYLGRESQSRCGVLVQAARNCALIHWRLNIPSPSRRFLRGVEISYRDKI